MLTKWAARAIAVLKAIRRGVVWVVEGESDNRRLVRWLLVGILSVSVLMLRDISGLLRSIESAGERAYDADVLTGFKFFFWDTAEFVDALRVWRQAIAPSFDVVNLIRWHALVDAIAFIPTYALLLARILRRVNSNTAFASWVAIALFTVDEIETLTTLFVLVPDRLTMTSDFELGTIKFFSLLKYLVLAVGVLGVIVTWAKNRRADPEARPLANAARRARTEGPQGPVIAVSGLVGLVVAFGALVALPVGGPLEQLPDVLRNHLSRSDLGLWLLSGTGLALFAAAVMVAGLVSTAKASETASTAHIEDKTMIIGAVFVTLVLLSLGCLIDGRANAAALAPTLVIVVLTIAALLSDVAKSERVKTKSEARKSVSKTLRRPKTPLKSELLELLGARLRHWDEGAAIWVAGLTASVVLIAGLGLVRAAFAPFLLNYEVLPETFPWVVAWILGGVVALSAGLIQGALTWLFVKEIRLPVGLGVLGLIVLAVVGGTVWLILSPTAGRLWGSTGVVGIAFAFWAIVIGSLTWVSRSRAHWDVPRRLGFGVRTPWLTLLVVTWVVASVLNSRGGYHDARVSEELGPSEPRYKDLVGAFEEWRIAQPAACADTSSPKTVPLVLVAAPGGGMRASYWAALALDELFADTCAAERLFAISGVSGGSIGATAWLAARSQDAGTGSNAVARMSTDRALPATMAGYLLRDLPQPLLGITDGWDDRATLLEDGWIQRAKVFGTTEAPRSWSDVTAGTDDSDTDENTPFVPVMALNGASVNDGCRVLVSNVGHLAAATGPDCQAASDAANRADGPVSGAVDAFKGLYKRHDEDRTCGSSALGMRAPTAALLSARFPFVSPSGALLRCVYGDVEAATYSVDGGYYENSGLLTLLQIWSAIEGPVRGHNQAVAETNVGPLGNTRIEPWIVVVDNHYRSETRNASPGAPLQTLAILEALRQEVLTQTMLEQAASFEMGVIDEECTVRGSEDASTPEAAPDDDEPPPTIDCPFRSRFPPGFVRIAPVVTPSVAAPLGWVLSPASRDNLRSELAKQLLRDDRALTMLLKELAGSG